MAKNKLSIYLIKEEIEEDKIFDKEKNNVEILKKHSDNKTSYFVPKILVVEYIINTILVTSI